MATLSVNLKGAYIEDGFRISINGSYPSNAKLVIIFLSPRGYGIGIEENIPSRTFDYNFSSEMLEDIYSDTPNQKNARFEFSLDAFGSEAVEKTFNIKPEPPTFDTIPVYEDFNAASVRLTGNNQILVNKWSKLNVTSISGQAYKSGTINTIEINGRSTLPYSSSITNIPVNNPDLELSLVLIDSRGWRSEKMILADASKFKYEAIKTKINNFEVERDGIAETTYLKGSGYYLEGYEVGRFPMPIDYKWQVTDSQTINTGETTLLLRKQPTTEWLDFNDIIDEYENPQYSTEDDVQYYTGTQWSNGISDLFSAAISYNDKYTQAYLEADYDSINDRYRVISGNYNGSWHNFWLDTIKAIYNAMYGDDGNGGNYEWEVVNNQQATSVPIVGDISTGFTMDNNFNIIFDISSPAQGQTISQNKLLTAATPAIDVYKNNIAIHGLYDETLGGTQIEGDLLADFVTEFDNDGTWAWRKWHSGWVELFAYYQFTGLNITTSSMGTYYGASQNIDLPFRLIDVYYSNGQETNTRSSGVYVYDISYTNNNTKVVTQFRAHASSPSASCGVKFYILGTYK